MLICLLFLQIGYTYYISFQVLAVLILIFVLLYFGFNIKISMLGIFSVMMFISFIFYTGIFSPQVISPKSTNSFLTVVALLVYSLIIFGFSLLYINRYINCLLFFRQLASSLILAIFITLTISELNLFPLLNREFFIIQNASLIDNFTDIESIKLSLKLKHEQGVDLFYGEASFLAIVIFASLGGFVIANEGLKTFSTQNFANTKVALLANKSNVITVLGIASLIYIQSLTSIICALVATFYSFSIQTFFKKISLIKLMFFLILTFILIASSWEYVVYRITMVEKYSLSQRFGFIFEMRPIDFLIGLKNVSLLPKYGIHNGLIYIIAIAGVGGMGYFLYLVQFAYKSANIIGLSAYSIFLILAIFMQNGGIFSPSKIVLMSLVLLPLAAVRSAKKGVNINLSSKVVS